MPLHSSLGNERNSISKKKRLLLQNIDRRTNEETDVITQLINVGSDHRKEGNGRRKFGEVKA